MEVDHDQPEDLSEVEPCNHLLEGLLAGAGRVPVNGFIIRRPRENLVFVVERPPLAVDGHRGIRREVQMGELRDGPAILHVRCVAARAEDTSNLHLGVRVRGCYEGAGRVVYEGSQLDRHSLGKY